MKRTTLVILVLLAAGECWGQKAVDFSKIAPAATLTAEQQAAKKTELKGLISKRLTPAKNDYVDDFDRGTVVWNEKEGNYSFQKVAIPDGTVVRGKNFTQKDPHTAAVTGKSLTFEDCNLTNVETDPTWTLIHSLSVQAKSVKVSETPSAGGVKITISRQIERKAEKGKYDEVEQYEDIVPADSYSAAVKRYQ